MSDKRTYTPNPYIRFDDRWFILIGLPIVALVASMIVSDVPISRYFTEFSTHYPSGVIFTAAYWAFNRYLMIQLRKRMPELKKALKRNVIQIAIAFLCYPVISFGVHQLLKLQETYLGLVCTHDVKDVIGLLFTYVLTFMILAIYEAVYFFYQYRDALMAQEKLKAEHANTQLTHLRNQVNPHFLFNSLNTLMGLIPGHDSDAHVYLQKLSSFYRYSVSEQDGLLVPIDKEIQYLKLYSDLISERFAGSFSMDIKLNGETRGSLLPMSLQMLVENAVKHNIVSKDQPLSVSVFQEGRHITVENVIQQRMTETKGTGTGLKNIKERYALVSSEQVLVKQENGLFSVSHPIDSERRMKVLIVEDEPHAARLLEEALKRESSAIEVIGQPDSVRSTLNWFEASDVSPDLIFMDIELADGSSFEVFKHLRLPAPVIFITAYDQYALDAFRVKALDYLLKPIDPVELRSALGRFNNEEKSRLDELQHRIDELASTFTKQVKKRFLVKKGSSYEFVAASDVAFAYSEDSVTFLYTYDGKRHLYSRSIEQLKDELDEREFYQINRGQLIHVENIVQVHTYLGQRLKLTVRSSPDGMDVLVSRQRSTTFKQWLDQ